MLRLKVLGALSNVLALLPLAIANNPGRRIEEDALHLHVLHISSLQIAQDIMYASIL